MLLHPVLLGMLLSSASENPLLSLTHMHTVSRGIYTLHSEFYAFSYDRTRNTALTPTNSWLLSSYMTHLMSDLNPQAMLNSDGILRSTNFLQNSCLKQPVQLSTRALVYQILVCHVCLFRP